MIKLLADPTSMQKLKLKKLLQNPRVRASTNCSSCVVCKALKILGFGQDTFTSGCGSVLGYYTTYNGEAKTCDEARSDIIYIIANLKRVTKI